MTVAYGIDAGIVRPALRALCLLCSAAAAAAATTDVLGEYHNRPVTALVEDSETVRLALGLAWDDALAARALADYLVPGAADAPSPAETDAMVGRGARMYELVKCIDDGISSVRLSRDSRTAPRLKADLRFWRNELGLAAREVQAYAGQATELRGRLGAQLTAQVGEQGIRAVRVAEQPWSDPQREAWRQAGMATGVRLPLGPRPGSMAEWWNRNLSVTPGYLVGKLHSAGERFFTPELPVGDWGGNAPAPGRYDWSRLNAAARLVADRGGQLLLELPTLQPRKTPAQATNEWQQAEKNGWDLLPYGHARCLPDWLADQTNASLLARQPDGKLVPHGGVQLLDADTARAYGEYLQAMARNLRREGLYAAIGALHLEVGDWADLPEEVDYSDITRERWRQFAAGRPVLQAAGAELPVRAVDPRAKTDWEAFGAKLDSGAWGGYLMGKYKSPDAIRAALGDDYKDGYGWRLPLVYPPVVGVEYLRFRRQWVRDYLAIKRGLVAAAFPDKLAIAETWQAGDHDGVQGKGERKWGGFLGEDWSQWSGTGPDSSAQPFAIRSVGPVGFGSRVSDCNESVFRDYLWLNFRVPGNLTRYFYHWVAHGYMDYQLGWHSIANHYLTNWRLYRLGPTLANTQPSPQAIGLLMPRAVYDLADGDIYYEHMGWDWVLQAAKLPYTRIDERLVREGKLGSLGLKGLILPGATAMDEMVAAAVRDWVAAGGTLVATTLPGVTDEYGRARPDCVLAEVLGAGVAGTVCEGIKDTPLTVTVPHGHYSGKWQTTTDRKPAFQVLQPTTARVLATYEDGRPAITLNAFGKGRVVTMGYPFGREAVECERTSIGFQRTYVWFVREPQLVARTAWLRKLLVEDLGLEAEYEVESAEVERFKGVEEIATGFHMPKGLSEDPASPWFIRTVGDPRPEHRIETVREAPDLALRFFPRQREGLSTRYLGISTREVHYLGPRAAVNMFLSRHRYRCRINNPRIRAIWDVALDAPVGFTRDDRGVAFTVQMPSGFIGLLAVSETPEVQLFGPAPFPGRERDEVMARLRKIAGGEKPARVVNLTPDECQAWIKSLKSPVAISYGIPANQAAAEKLAGVLRQRFGLEATVREQWANVPAAFDQPLGKEYETPVIFIGDEWSNNDLAMHGAYWGTAYGPHLPFTATYAWPGPGRAVVSLSRPYALVDENGHVPFQFGAGIRIRPVEDRWSLVRRKLYVAGNGNDALAAVDAVIKELERQ